MKIFNIMLSKKLGGLEQVSVDYSFMLQQAGHDVITITSSHSKIIPLLQQKNLKFLTIKSSYFWNVIAYVRMRYMVCKADLVILHGNRAGVITRYINKHIPKLAVVHSRFFKLLSHFDALITLSLDAFNRYRHACTLPVFKLANSIPVPSSLPQRPAFRTPVVIGALGRLSHEKGMDILLDALHILKTQHVPCHLLIGGDGAEKEALQQQAEQLGLQDHVSFYGWVSDKDDFFSRIDIMCLPSRTESFPVTLLEAQAQSIPIVATRCGGPSEIITHGKTGYLADITAESLAHYIALLIHDPAHAVTMGQQAYHHALTHYDTKIITKELDQIVTTCYKKTSP